MAADHRVRWFGIVPGSGERIPRNRVMPASCWGWDAVCSCGWETRTGGAIRERIREAVADHHADVRSEAVA